MLQHTAVCCSVLQCVALLNPRSLYLNKTKGCPEIVSYPPALTTVLQCVAGCCTSVGGAHNLRGTPLTGHTTYGAHHLRGTQLTITTYKHHLQTPKHVCTAACMHGCLVIDRMPGPASDACMVPSICATQLQDHTHLRRQGDRQVLRHSDRQT